MSTPISFTERDLHIVVKGMQQLLGNTACCHVCGAPAPLSDKAAGAIATGVDGKLTLIPFCAKHLADAPKLFPSNGPVEMSIDSAQIEPAYDGYIEYLKPLTEYRYFIVHPLSQMVPESARHVPMVMVIDSLADDHLLGIVPCALTDDEIAEPLFVRQGELAAECLEALNQVKAGKRRYRYAGGLLIAEADEDPIRVENPRVREATK